MSSPEVKPDRRLKRIAVIAAGIIAVGIATYALFPAPHTDHTSATIKVEQVAVTQSGWVDRQLVVADPITHKGFLTTNELKREAFPGSVEVFRSEGGALGVRIHWNEARVDARAFKSTANSGGYEPVNFALEG